jgi:hypothetical protein
LESDAHPRVAPPKTTSPAASPLSPGTSPPLVALTGLQSARLVDLAPYWLSTPALTFSDLRGLESTSWQMWGEPPAAALSCPFVSRSEYDLRGSLYPCRSRRNGCVSARSPVSPPENRLSLCTTLASTDDFGNLPGSFDLLAEILLVPVDACTSIDPHNNLAADASSASRRSTAATKTRGTDLVGTDRSPPDSGDTTTRQARPVANPSPRRSEQRPAARRLVPYQLDTRRALRKPGGSVVCQRRPNLGCPHRSARSARRQQLHSGHGET